MVERHPVPHKQSRGEARRQAMLEAAADLFMEKGFERTSLTDVIERSKGSRSTLYEAFGNKEGLLRAMVAEVGRTIWDQAILDFTASRQTRSVVSEDSLIRFGLHLLQTATTPLSVAVYRVVVAEAHRFPEIAALFFDSGPRVLVERLTEVFRSGQEDGVVIAGDPRHLAQVFIGTLFGDFHIRRTLGLVPAIPPAEMEVHVRAAVQVFLNGAGIGG